MTGTRKTKNAVAPRKKSLPAQKAQAKTPKARAKTPKARAKAPKGQAKSGQKNGNGKIAFQGKPGAYSHLACRKAYPELEPLSCESFEAAFDAVSAGRAELAMIPIDNSIAGRVADIHHLLPRARLHIVAEHFLPVRHCLLGVQGTRISDVKEALSHIHALPQCRRFLAQHRIRPVVFSDTASSAAEVARLADASKAAIASELAADIHGLAVLKRGIEDESHNTTRFIVLARGPHMPAREPDARYVTSLVFRVRNIPAALYKALGGFATNGVNLSKLESYMVDGNFTAAQFFCEVDGHPHDRPLQLALEELAFFADEVRILGTYAADPFRS